MELFKEDDFNPNSHYADSVKDISRYGTHYDIIQEIWNTYSYDLILMMIQSSNFIRMEMI